MPFSSAVSVTVDSELNRSTIHIASSTFPHGEATAPGVDTQNPVARLRAGTGATTVAKVVTAQDLDTGVALIAESVAKSLDVTSDTTVAVESTTVETASSVTFAPVARLSIRGGERSIRRQLSAVPLSIGDVESVSFLDETLDLPVRVVDAAPAAPITISDSTELILEGGPATHPTDQYQGPVPPHSVGGYDVLKSKYQAAVVSPITQADGYHIDGQSVSGGVLFEGQNGVGKTQHIRHAGWLADARIVRVNAGRLPEFDTDSLQDHLTEYASTAINGGSSLVHVDNLDFVSDDNHSALLEILGGWIERLNKQDGVIVVGETTDSEDIGTVLTRGGRLDRTISLSAPDEQDRADILRILFDDADFDSGLSLSLISKKTLGYVAADLVSLRSKVFETALERQSGDTATTPHLIDADFETALAETTPSTADPTQSVPSITFEDIGGLSEAKRELTRAVEWPLQYPDALAELGVDAPAGVLLYGPPGTGKTMLARAVASTTDANFLTVNGPELLNKYVGESERRVRQLFARARDSAPVVIFFDELDALGSSRTSEGESSAPERVVSQLLTELDGITPRQQLTVIGATNRPDRIDDALVRPGRFDRLVEVPLPDYEARKDIIRIHIADRPVESPDIEYLAAETENYSGSDIAALLQEASLLAVEANIEQATERGESPAETLSSVTLTQNHIELALERVGPSLSSQARERYASFSRE